jgi:hypothetical protein
MIMELELYKEISLTRDVPTENLRRGDVAVLVDIVSHPSDGEDGAVLEVFNAVGESIMVTTVPISAIAPLQSNQVPAVRPFVQAV